ncbi:MAG: DUF3472 domain-containing protein [Gemmatimonadetes bacterium]|nr:DUF3472 domain-containing protein [Gemmatimonadota bacterium]
MVSWKCISSLGLLAFVCHAATGAGSTDGRETSMAISVNANGDDTASIPDFDGDGTIGFGDFLIFGGVYGSSDGDEKYEATYDLNGDGEIGFADFLIFAENYGKEVAQAIMSLAMAPARLTPAHAGKQGADTIVVTALDGEGSPVAGAGYRWSTDRYSGWVYPAHGVTDDLGRLQTTWVAGWPGKGTLSLTVENESSRLTKELATLSTTPANPPAGDATIWIHNRNHPSAGYSIDMTPLTEPTGTFYVAIQWDGGYTGLQRGGDRFDRQLQFSVWDAPGFGDAKLIDKASDVVCGTFGGEGTGVKCRLDYRWTVESTYRFEITEVEMNGGSAITLHVTDLATESRRFVGTLRFARRAQMRSFGMFVEDFIVRAQHCLAREVRSVAFRRPRAWLDGDWVALYVMTRGTLSGWTNDAWNPGTPRCANVAAREHAAGLELVIGGKTASDPNASPYYIVPAN